MPDLLYYILAGLILVFGLIVVLRKPPKASDGKARFIFLSVVVAAEVVLVILWLGIGGLIFGGC